MMRKCHEVDYEIIGDAMQLVVVELDPRETVIAEAGAMTYMEEGIVFEAKMGDGSDADQGLLVSLHVHRGLFRAVLAALSVGEAWPGNGAAWQFRVPGRKMAVACLGRFALAGRSFTLSATPSSGDSQ